MERERAQPYQPGQQVRAGRKEGSDEDDRREGPVAYSTHATVKRTEANRQALLSQAIG